MTGIVYFKNLNALRFFAALLVIIHHVEQIKDFFAIPSYWSSPFIKELGGLGVTLFFVLSGFLITYLLLKEKQETQTISIRDFYMRRILRIWPLYYVVVILAFFIFSNLPFFSMPGYSDQMQEQFGYKLLLFVLFFPNLALVLFAPVPFASQAWSVGVEEQFYLVWPVLVKKFKSILIMLLAVIFFYLLVKFSLIHASIKFSKHVFLISISDFWKSFRIDCMAIGGLSAYILFYQKNKLLTLLFNKLLQAAVYVLTVFLISRGYVFPLFNPEVYAILFSYIILNLAANPATVINPENKPLNYLGKISYGLYMYHAVCITVSIKLGLYFNISSSAFIYCVSILLSVLLSSLSYELLESRFIRLKRKYSKIISGTDALDTSTAVKERSL